MDRSWGLRHLMPPPLPLGHPPHIGIVLQKVSKNSAGVKGTLPQIEKDGWFLGG